MATGKGEGAALRLAEFLPYRLSVVSEMVSRQFSRTYAARFGLGIPEWRVMAVLGEHGDLATQEVIALTQMDRVRVSRAVIRLSDKGLVRRTAQDGDQRAQRLSLSARGRETYGEIVPLADAIQAGLVAALGPRDADQLSQLLARLQQVASVSALAETFAKGSPE